MIVNIVSGSPLVSLDLIKQNKCDYLIGVDYAAYNLIANKINVDTAIGDFDSITKKQFEVIENNCQNVLVYPVEKNETDTELALEFALNLNPAEINLFGVTGKRIDHFLGAFYLFKKTLKSNVKLNIIDEHNLLYILKPGTYSLTKDNYKYISFFSFQEPVVNLSLTGFKYPLNNHLLKNENSLCLSNEIVSTYGTLSFSAGILLIVESND